MNTAIWKMLTDEDVLQSMPPITLQEMDSVRLMDRIDTKYLTGSRTLLDVIADAAESGYLVFEDHCRRVLEYRSMYYDTTDLKMYKDHHNRRLTRQKLRTRCYADTGDTFMELKSKDNHGRTRKKRMKISRSLYDVPFVDNTEELDWLDGKLTYDVNGLSRALETSFRRITLVNPEWTERSTIDMDLSFRNVRDGVTADLGHLAVIEVKQNGNLPSLMREILLEHRVKPFHISKYCIGTAMTSTSVPYGRFKNKIMVINKYIEAYV